GRVTRSLFSGSGRNRLRQNRTCGSELTARRTAGDRTDGQVIRMRSRIRRPDDTTPSLNDTSRDSRMVARVEPMATVMTRSKAFSFDSVRLPEIPSRTRSARYAGAPTATTRTRSIQERSIQEWKNMGPSDDRGCFRKEDARVAPPPEEKPLARPTRIA